MSKCQEIPKQELFFYYYHMQLNSDFLEIILPATSRPFILNLLSCQSGAAQGIAALL